MRRTRVLLAAALAAALVLATACSGADDADDADDTADTADTADAATEATAADDSSEPAADGEEEDAVATEAEEESADATPEAGGDSRTFTMHAVLATSGPLAAIGGAMRQGMEAAVEVINADGGVFGNPMTLEVIDSASQPTEAVAAVQQLLSQDAVRALGAGTASNEISAVVPITQQHEVFVVHHGAGIGDEFFDTSQYPYVFGTAYQPSDQGISMAEELSAQGFERVGVVTTDNVAGEASYEAMSAAFEERGIASEAVFVPPDAVDVTPQMQQILATDPEVLVLDTFGAVAGPVIMARSTLGVDLPTYGSQYLTSTGLADLVEEDQLADLTLQALSVGVAGTEVTESESFQTFYDALLEVTGGDLTFTMNTYAVGYNDVILAATAARLADTDEAAAMAEALESASPEDFALIVGPADYSAERHVPTFGPEFWTFVAYGPTIDGLLNPAS